MTGAVVATALCVTTVPMREAPVANDAFLVKNQTGIVTVLRKTRSGLQLRALTPAYGAKPRDGGIIPVMYVAPRYHLRRSRRPTQMVVSGIIPGFAEGVKLMPTGFRHRCWIKPELGYGARAKGPIPANAPLVFGIQLMAFLQDAAAH